MIASFKHKGLRNANKLPPNQRSKIRLILDTLNDVSEMPKDLELFKNWRVHQLSGSYDGYWSLTVKENWRIIFQFQDGLIINIDYLDYH